MKNKSKSSRNVLIILLGIIAIIIGFVCLSQGPADNSVSLTIAPLVLMFAYLVLVPLGILYSGKSSENDEKGD